MEKLMQSFKLVGFEIALFLAGIFGAFVSQKAKKMSTWERLSTILGGGFIANYITPIFLDILNISERTSYGMAFIVGYLGLKSIEMVIDFIKDRFKADKNEV
jgi:hypothetical protein